MKIDTRLAAPLWDQFVAAYPQGHLLQTTPWGEQKSGFGWSVKRIAVQNGPDIVAGAQILFRRLPLGTTLAYIPKGPLVDFDNAAQSRLLFDALHRLCRVQRAILLKIEPDLPEAAQLPAKLQPYKFQPGVQTIQPRRTILLDLTGSEDEILRRMKSKTRYNIRLARRKGISVYEGGEQDLDAFVHLMDTTGERNAFGVRSTDYYRRAYRLFHPPDMIRLFMAAFEGEPIAGLMVFACGRKAWYMYGASGNKHRAKMPNYALQWAAICWARSRGCHTYDLYGVPDEEMETLEREFTTRHEGLWGVYRFKRGFGGQLLRYAETMDYVYNKPLAWIYHKILKMR